MSTENEPAKLLLPYLQRADELQKHEPLVAYYCRLYAMERGLVIPQKERTKTTNALLVSLMNQLEKDLEPSNSNFATSAEPGRGDPSATIPPDSDSSPQPYDQVNLQHSTNISPQPSNSMPSPPSNISTPHHYSTNDYPSDTFHQPPPSNNSEHTIYPQSYHQQPYQPEPQQHFPQHYTSQNVPSYSYPNFQSYPSFTESSIPTAPSHYPSYYQGPDASYSNLPPADPATYPSSAQYNSVARNGSFSEASPTTTTPKYEYDSSYQPPPEQISEAHKAARFAVGALAFDDVSVAVDYLKKSLELLTKPSAGN
ncbi:UNVERIFIED_CONTAM: protein OF MAMMALIAN LYST-INTERACTING PROTEIN 5 [Sesamum radiatum]|uniref:Protein OF MAMMALIAN LYST-INTERACTING PROTEIN 5 n=1 Tax=Sesamum radiatum TaxID=300843 RepID=A0AAW2LPG5_SESRA